VARRSDRRIADAAGEATELTQSAARVQSALQAKRESVNIPANKGEMPFHMGEA
jgi:hypothetical protein